MRDFRFEPQLFELRSAVIEQLTAAGFDWLTDYSAVDVMHDVYGIEVCGIHYRDIAVQIRSLLQKLFPTWVHRPLFLKDYGLEPGWEVVVHRDPEPPDESWESSRIPL